MTFRRPFSKLAQTPSFRVSLGHDLLGFGFGFGLGGVQALTKEKNTRLSKRNKASDVFLLVAIVFFGGLK